MKFPKLTHAQLIAAVGFAGTEAVSFGLLSGGTEQLVVSIAGIVLPGVLMVADAIVHHAFAKINVAQLETEARKAIAELEHKNAPAAAAKK